MSVYDSETFDFRVVPGGTVNVPLLVQVNGVDLDITATSPVCRIYSPHTKLEVTTRSVTVNDVTTTYDMTRTHDDAATGGKGCYLYGDVQAWSELALTAVSNLQIVFGPNQTADFRRGEVWPIIVTLASTVNGVSVVRPLVRGNLVVGDWSNVQTYRTVQFGGFY